MKLADFLAFWEAYAAKAEAQEAVARVDLTIQAVLEDARELDLEPPPPTVPQNAPGHPVFQTGI